MAELPQNDYTMKSYHSPKTEVLEISPYDVICQSQGMTLSNFGDEGAAGGAVNNENIVDGGTF